MLRFLNFVTPRIDLYFRDHEGVIFGFASDSAPDAPTQRDLTLTPDRAYRIDRLTLEYRVKGECHLSIPLWGAWTFEGGFAHPGTPWQSGELVVQRQPRLYTPKDLLSASVVCRNAGEAWVLLKMSAEPVLDGSSNPKG